MNDSVNSDSGYSTLYFCQELRILDPSIELVSHLFIECTPVKKLWEDTSSWLNALNVTLSLHSKSLLFGFRDEPCNSVKKLCDFERKILYLVAKTKKKFTNYFLYV